MELQKDCYTGLDLALLQKAGIAFGAFCLTASSVYLLNDLADINHDRRHPSKCKRPIAAGLVAIPVAATLVILLLAAAGGLCRLLPVTFQCVLLSYYSLTFCYSFWLKRVLLVDVIVLAGLYVIRLVAGGAATATFPSFWLLTFSGFFFLSLSLVKRYTELKNAADTNRGDPSGRGYLLPDVNQIAMLGSTSGMVSVLVVALYVSSPQVQPLYRSPMLLLFLCPVLLYWLARIWILAGRKQIHDDPIVFTVKDRVSYCIGAAMAIIVIAATFIG